MAHTHRVQYLPVQQVWQNSSLRATTSLRDTVPMEIWGPREKPDILGFYGTSGCCHCYWLVKHSLNSKVFLWDLSLGLVTLSWNSCYHIYGAEMI